MTQPNSKVVIGAVIAQGIILTISAVIFLSVLPANGIVDLRQIDSVETFRRVEGWLLLVNVMHFIFAVGIGVVSLHLFQRISQRSSRVVRLAVAIVLAPACIFVIGHDLGFGLLTWPGIAANPADTVFSADLQLLNARNVVFFVLGLIALIDVYQQQRQPTAVAA